MTNDDPNSKDINELKYKTALAMIYQTNMHYQNIKNKYDKKSQEYSNILKEKVEVSNKLINSFFDLKKSICKNILVKKSRQKQVVR